MAPDARYLVMAAATIDEVFCLGNHDQYISSGQTFAHEKFPAPPSLQRPAGSSHAARARSIPVGNRQFLRREQCDDLAAPIGDHQLFFDARG